MIQDFKKNGYHIANVHFEIQDYIIATYLADMNKYTENTEGIKNSRIYNAIPKELARENNTFKYKTQQKCQSSSVRLNIGIIASQCVSEK